MRMPRKTTKVMILLVHDLCWSFLDRMRLGVKNNAIPKPMSRTGHHTEINVQMDTCRRPRLSRSNRRPRPIRQAGKKKPWSMPVIVRKRKGVCHKGGHRRFFSFTRDAIGPSSDSDEPITPLVLPTCEIRHSHTLAFNQGPGDGSLTQESAPCIRAYASRREYVFMEPRERGCVLFPSSGTPHEYLRRSLIRGGRRERDHRFGIQCVELLRPFRKGGRRPLVLPKYQGKPAMQER